MDSRMSLQGREFATRLNHSVQLQHVAELNSRAEKEMQPLSENIPNEL
jgi:hypothetical protein